MADGFIGEVPLYLSVVLGGAVLMFLLARRRDLAYPLMPGLWFVGRYVYDLGVGPLAQGWLEISPFEIFGFSSDERMRIDALGLGIQAGIALAIGFLLCKWYLLPLINADRKKDRPDEAVKAGFGDAAWLPAVITASLGAVLWLLWIQLAGGFAAAFEGGMQERIFSSGLEIETPFSVYIRMGVQFLPLGALMLVGLSGRNRRKQVVAAGFVLLALIAFFFAGGRGRLAYFTVGCLIVWHERIGRISLRHIAVVGLAGAVLMVIISFLRGGEMQLTGFSLVSALIFTFANPDRVDSIAWIRDTFPAIQPFTGGSSILNSLYNVFPFIVFPGMSSMWGTVADTLFGGERLNTGSGGWNFHGAAEFYMNFGVPGVWVGFFLLGVILSSLFAYVRRWRGELFPTVILATAIPLFSVGVGTRPNDSLAGFAISLSMMGAVASAMNPRRALNRSVLLGGLLCVMLFFGWKILGSEELRWGLGGAMLLLVPMSIATALTTRDKAL